MKRQIDEIFNNNIENQQKLFSILCINIPKIAKSLNIDSMIIDINIATEKNTNHNKNIVIINGVKKTSTVYNTYINDTDNIIIKYSPITEKFSNEDKEQIEYLNSKILLKYLLCTSYEHKRQLMYKDTMTGAYNVFGMATIWDDKQNKNDYSIIFIDIKNFKAINKELGMYQGNIVLKKYYEIARNNLKSDEEICRPGGTFFGAIIRTDDIINTLSLLSNVNIELNINGLNKNIIVSARIGLIKPQSNNQNFYELLEKAHNALICAKKQKKDIFIMNKETIKIAEKQENIKKSFEPALKNKEFQVYYQPKVDSIKNKLCGAEALVRWIHDNKFIPPLDFIPYLIQENKIEALDYYVLSQVCEDIKGWIGNCIEPVKISVNFEKQHLKDKRFAEKILEIIDNNNIPHEYIEIELTETSLYDNIEQLTLFIEKMKKNSINVSIDDFGTGYSSLSFLKDLDVSTIKIDKTFIDSMDDKKNNIIISHIIKMMNELNLEIIAEGIEKEEQIALLKDLGCYIIQGYYYDKPLPYEEFVNRLKNQTYTK